MYVKEEKEGVVAPYRPASYYWKQEQKKRAQATENAQKRHLQEIVEDEADEYYYDSSFLYEEPATEVEDSD
jgi:hypothetical protein